MTKIAQKNDNNIIYTFERKTNMWLDNIKELKKTKGMTTKQIAEVTKLPERTVIRIFSGDTNNPYVDTLHRIVTVLGGSLDDILADTKVVVGDENLATLQENVDAVTAERDLIIAENAMLKEKVTALTSENELLKMQLMHKDEIIALHNYYNKLKPNK
jgi:transcriptional regulator with XRE-family HTH domain